MKYQQILPTVLCLALATVSGSAGASAPNSEKAAESSYEEARPLLRGNGPEADARKGFELMLQSARAGYLPAAAGVAYLYTKGQGVPKDNLEAAKWLRLAAEKEHPVSRFNLGKLLISDEIPLPAGSADRAAQHREGVEWIRKAADQQLLEARSTYGIILLRGDAGTKTDPAAAARYLIPAAEEHHPEALNALGTMYQTGNGVDHLPASAERCFREAAMRGHVKAQANLGEHLDPMSPNHAIRIEALAWLYLAEDSRDPVAMKILQNKMAVITPQDTTVARKKAAEIRREIQKAGNG